MKGKKNMFMYIITICFVLFSILFFVHAFYQRKIYEDNYNEALKLIDQKKYDEALEILEDMREYIGVEDLLNGVKMERLYEEALKYFDEEKYSCAADIFSQIKDYKDANQKYNESNYLLAIQYYENSDYQSAKKIFIELDNYLDSKFYLAQIDIKSIEQSQEIVYQRALILYKEKNYKEAIEIYETIREYKDSNKLIEECELYLRRMSHNNLVAAGIRHSAAIKSDHSVIFSGRENMDLDSSKNWENIISIDIYGTLFIGLQENGDAKIAGTYDGKKVTNQENWYDLIDIAAGEQFIIGLRKDGSVIADGHPSDGQLEVDNWKNVIAIDAGSRFAVGLTEDKRLLFAGVDNGQEEEFLDHMDEWQDVINIAASGGEKGRIGRGHTVGLKSDGTLVAVGDNQYGQCDFSDKEKWSDIIKVVAGDWYTVGLKADGSVVITGINSPGRKYIDEKILETCTNIVDIAAGYGQTICLTKDGMVKAFGFNDDNKCSETMNNEDWMNLLVSVE